MKRNELENYVESVERDGRRYSKIEWRMLKEDVIKIDYSKMIDD